MKKLLTALLVLSLMFSLSACCFNSKDNNVIDVSGNVVENEEKDESSETAKEEAKDESDDASEEESDDVSEEESDDVSEEESDDMSEEESKNENEQKVISRGVISGDVYHSDFSGLSFNKPSNWYYATDAELAEMINVGAEMLDQSEFQQSMAKLASVYDMLAKDPISGATIMVVYENLAFSGNASMNEVDYFDALKQNLSLQSVISYSFGAMSTVSIGDNTYYKLNVIGNYNGAMVCQSYYVRKIGEYMLSIITTSSSADGLAEIESLLD